MSAQKSRAEETLERGRTPLDTESLLVSNIKIEKTYFFYSRWLQRAEYGSKWPLNQDCLYLVSGSFFTEFRL